MAHPDQDQLSTRGFCVVADALTASERNAVDRSLAHHSCSSRLLLEDAVIRSIPRRLRGHPRLGYLIDDRHAVQCTLFHKTQDHNWGVAAHRDEVIPIARSADADPAAAPPWPNSGTKEGMTCSRAPREFLDRCLAVRIALDAAPEGDLRLAIGSHRDDTDTPATECPPIAAGAALVMFPTTIHSSAKLRTAPSRRVLHFLFVPADELPHGFAWYHRL